jgi:hypothetical protein
MWDIQQPFDCIWKTNFSASAPQSLAFLTSGVAVGTEDGNVYSFGGQTEPRSAKGGNASLKFVRRAIRIQAGNDAVWCVANADEEGETLVACGASGVVSFIDKHLKNWEYSTHFLGSLKRDSEGIMHILDSDATKADADKVQKLADPGKKRKMRLTSALPGYGAPVLTMDPLQALHRVAVSTKNSIAAYGGQAGLVRLQPFRLE